MATEEMFLLPAGSNLENIVEWFFLWSGVTFFFLGAIGMLLLITGALRLSETLQFAFGFINIYMIIFGLFLISFRKKIFIKPKRT